MRIVFLGSGAFGLPTLQALAATHEVLAVVSQPDRPAGRGGMMTPTPIAEWAAATLPGTPLVRPASVNAAEVVERLHALDAQAWVVIAFGQKLSRRLLEERFVINLHASLLPRWRGAAPINAAVLAGDAVTGNSVITLAETMDAGLVLGQSTRAVDPQATAGEVHDQLSGDGPALVESVLAAHAAGTLERRAQDEAQVTIAPKMSKADGWVDLTEGAEACRRRVHGLTPWPGVTVRFRDEPLKLLRVRPLAAGAGGTPEGFRAGTLLDAAAGIVACGEGTALALVEVQPAGKRPMPWADFARGRQPKAGEGIIGGRPA